MNIITRFGRLRSLLCAAILLTWSAGRVDAGFDRDAGFEDKDGTNGTFRVIFEGEGLRVDKVTASFEKSLFSLGTLTLRDWHVRIRFLDSNNKEYARFDQKNQPGPSNKGDFVWRPPKGFELKPASRDKPGKAQIFLIEKRGGKEVEVTRVEGDIFGRAAKPDHPALVRLEQAPPRSHPKLKLPQGHAVGPTIPGLKQGAIPQGLAFWGQQNWLLISCDFDKDQPSVVVAIDNKTGKMVRCLTLVQPDGQAHTGHVGGLAVSPKYLWVGDGGTVHRVPLDDLKAAKSVDHLRLRDPFRPESPGSFLAYQDKRLWVGEFVGGEVEGKPTHDLKDRNGTTNKAWASSYALDANDNLAGGRDPAPSAILSIGEKVQGMAFLDKQIILSVSLGRDKDSTLAVYTNPLGEKPHRTVKVKGKDVPVWFLDGKNRVREIEYPPQSEGIVAVGKRLAVISESGAEKYQQGGKGPLDSVIFLDLPAGK